MRSTGFTGFNDSSALRRLLTSLSFLVLLTLIPGLAGATGPEAVGGHWEGSIQLPSQELPVMIDLEKDGEAWKGTIDIPTQGARDLPLGGIAVEGSTVRFAIPGIQGDPSFEGVLEGGEIRGTFTQGGGKVPFRLGRQAVELPRRPQEPKPPYPYREEEVTYANGESKLAGTLTIPEGEGPFPAVLLITGSGAQDRDESIGGHKPFRVLADHLSRRGIAVLRVDDRGVGGSTGSVWDSTSADFAQDALAGVRFLKQHGKIVPNRIGLLGHSEGGIVAPLAASQSPDVAFAVLLAGPGEPALEILPVQVELILRADGRPEDEIRKQAKVARRVVQAAIDEKDVDTLRIKLRELSLEEASLSPKEEIDSQGGLEAWLDRNVWLYSSNWFRFFAQHDPRPALRKVTVPVLALNGELDLQVPADRNLPQIEKTLKEAGNRDVTIRSLPGLNHLFQPAKTGSLKEYANIETTMAPEVLDLVAGWIRDRFVKPGAVAAN